MNKNDKEKYLEYINENLKKDINEIIKKYKLFDVSERKIALKIIEILKEGYTEIIPF